MYWLKLSIIFTFKIISEHNYLLLSNLFMVNFVLNNTWDKISQMKCFQIGELYHWLKLCHKYGEAAQSSQPSCFTSLRVKLWAYFRAPFYQAEKIRDPINSRDLDLPLTRIKKLVDSPRMFPSLTCIGRIQGLWPTRWILAILICKWAIITSLYLSRLIKRGPDADAMKPIHVENCA